MQEDFLEILLAKHKTTEYYPSTSQVSRVITKILLLLFPEQTKVHFHTKEELLQSFSALETQLAELFDSMQRALPAPAYKLASAFVSKLPHIHHQLSTDVQAIMNGDPAAKSEYEIVRAYPGFYAIAFYRLAHGLYQLGVPLLPRIITEFAHSKTGIDIHPGASIADHFFIDHGTGIVIGETTVIGSHVKLYQGVTLGALSVSKDMVSKKRHPTIEDEVVIYSNATILGGDTVVGKGSIIGGNVWLTRSVAPYTKIYHQEQVKLA